MLDAPKQEIVSIDHRTSKDKVLANSTLWSDATYAVLEIGAALHPRDLCFLVLVAGKAGHEHQKRMILGGLAAPGTLWVNRPARATRPVCMRPRDMLDYWRLYQGYRGQTRRSTMSDRAATTA
jgi:hypothetical protein